MDKQIVVYKVSDGSEQKMGGRPIAIYNLDVVISVGYRVKSFQGTRFRQWATTNRRPSRMGGHENGIIRNEKREKDAGRQRKGPILFEVKGLEGDEKR